MEIYEEIRTDREHGARRMVAAYKDRLYSAALMFGCEAHDAEDLVFRTFAQALAKIRHFKPRGEGDSFRNWLFRILVNFRRMDLRKSRRRIELVFPDALPEAASPEPDGFARLAAKADAGRVRAAVARLPEGLRAAVVLRYFEDMPTPEIAALLQIPEGTVRSRLHYAKALLHSFLNV